MSYDQRPGELKGVDKAAALLLTLSAEESVNVFRCIDEQYVERITNRLLHREAFPPGAQDVVIQEAHALVTGEQALAVGGVSYARFLLAKTLGPERAETIIQKLVSKIQSRPFHYIEDIEPAQIAQFLHNEHPQVIALVLSYLSSSKSADILTLLPEKLQPQVSFRLANMDTVDPAIVAQIETGFRKKLSAVLDAESRSKTGGLDYLVQVLTQVDRSTERSIIEQLDLSAPDLATTIKQQMFVFENLTLLDDRSTQRVLREVDYRDLALALRGATKAVRAHVFKNLSQRAATSINDDLENSPPVRMKTIEEAQQRIVEVVRRLEDEEEIAVGRGANDVLV